MDEVFTAYYDMDGRKIKVKNYESLDYTLKYKAIGKNKSLMVNDLRWLLKREAAYLRATAAEMEKAADGRVDVR